jgi:hypothetical protein
MSHCYCTPSLVADVMPHTIVRRGKNNSHPNSRRWCLLPLRYIFIQQIDALLFCAHQLSDLSLALIPLPLVFLNDRYSLNLYHLKVDKLYCNADDAKLFAAASSLNDALSPNRFAAL